MPMLLYIVRSLSAAIGFLALYAALFMYQDETGKWQSQIETLWVAIDDRRNLTGSKTSALFNKVGAVVTRGFNAVFGRKLLSFQSVGVSSSYSFAGMFLLTFFLLVIALQPGILTPPLSEDLSKTFAFLEHACLILGLIFFLLAALPSLSPSRWFVGLSLLPCLFLAAGLIYMLRTHRVSQRHVAFFAALVLSLISDILLVALVRFTVRWLSTNTSASRIALAVSMQVGLIVLLVVAPFEIATNPLIDIRQRPMHQALGTIAVLNAFTGLVSSIFLLTLFFVLLHKVFWPLLSRLFYPLARYQLIRNRKIMASVGISCLIFAFPSIAASVKSILEWLAKIRAL